LKDLKKILKRDDDTTERAVFTKLGLWDIMNRDLLPLLMVTDVEVNARIVMSVGRF
jgi:hypothetical protein